MESFEEFVSVEVRRCINQQRRTEIRKRNNLLPRNSNDERMGNFLRDRKMEVVMQLVFYIICFIAFFPVRLPILFLSDSFQSSLTFCEIIFQCFLTRLIFPLQFEVISKNMNYGICYNYLQYELLYFQFTVLIVD